MAEMVLSTAQIESKLPTLPGWKLEGGALAKEMGFADFTEAFAFVTRLALLGEKTGHHPDIVLRYNQLRIGLVSHDAGGITQRDLAMAGQIQSMIGNTRAQ
jgi:4a-hydroxytetrahydrobiopterin dehydratase